MTVYDLQMTVNDLQMTLRPKMMIPSYQARQMLQKWSNILFSNSHYSPAIYEKPVFLRWLDAYSTPCSPSFQDKWDILYIFEKPGSRAFQKMLLEVIWRHQAQATSRNVEKKILNFFLNANEQSHK